MTVGLVPAEFEIVNEPTRPRNYMKNPSKTLTLAATLVAVVMLSRPAAAQLTNYTDAIGDVFTGAGGGILDITAVEVSNDASDVIFKISLNGPLTTDWGKYLIGIYTTPGGDTNGNGWGRPIKMASGMNYWVGSWVDSGNGAEVYSYGGAWSLVNATYGTPGGLSISKSGSSATIRYPFASLGLSTNGGNNIFEFDVYTSGGGGGDGAVDALSTTNQTISDWGNSFTTTSNRSYTILPPNTPTNRVFFSVDMQVPIALFSSNPIPPTAFEPGVDRLYVVGSFNAFAASAPYELFPVGSSTVYTNTVDVVANLGSTVDYKFKGEAFPGFEKPYSTCGGDRSLTITSTNMSAPAVYWNDSQLSDPNNTVTLQVDMALPLATGAFVPPADNVYARGDFNEWAAPGLLLTNIPATTLYAGSVTFPFYPLGGCIPLKYKYLINSDYETSPDRQTNVTTLDPTLTSFYNNLKICDVIEQTNFITFTVSMTNAVGVTNGVSEMVYDGTQNVYLNGNFIPWWGWGDTNNVATNYLMTQISGTSNYTLTVALPPGKSLRMQYKYSMNGNDDESGFEQDHVRYIRTTPGQTSYTLPRDNWLGTNATYLATRAEPKFGNLVAAPGAPGQVQINWLGLKCVELQSLSSLSLSNWTSYPATDGQSSTNWPAASSQGYFRLLDKNP